MYEPKHLILINWESFSILEQKLDMAASCELTAKIGINDQHFVLGNEKNGLKLTNVEDIELFKALKHVSKYPWLK